MFEDVDMRGASPPLENLRESLEPARSAHALAVPPNVNMRGSRVTMISRNLPHMKGKGRVTYTDPDNESSDISRSGGGAGTRFKAAALSAFGGNEVSRTIPC